MGTRPSSPRSTCWRGTTLLAQASLHLARRKVTGNQTGDADAYFGFKKNLQGK
jgi:hypothetical protein